MEFGHSRYDGQSAQSGSCELMYSCADCGKLYMHKRTLKRHELVHSSASCFTCLVCGKQYSQQYDLDRHSRSHRGDKPYKCYVCGRPFAMSHHLNNHMVTHTGVRAYSCLICSKRFAQTFSLKRHMRMHLRAAESVAAADGPASAGVGSVSADGSHGLSVGGMALLQSLSCNICGKIFSSQQTLKRHRCQLGTANAACGRQTLPTSRQTLPTSAMMYVSRSPHRCHTCGIEFGSLVQLKEHAADVHPDVKPKKLYPCSDCDKSFAHPYSLKRHRVEHGGEAHVCTTCGKRFAQLYELSRHVKSHNVDRPLNAADYNKSVGPASTAGNRERHEMDPTVRPCISASELPNETHNSFSMQIAKYMALQDAQTGLTNHLLFRDGHLPKPGDVGLLAFAQSLVISSAPAAHTTSHSVTIASTASE